MNNIVIVQTSLILQLHATMEFLQQQEIRNVNIDNIFVGPNWKDQQIFTSHHEINRISDETDTFTMKTKPHVLAIEIESRLNYILIKIHIQKMSFICS